MVVAKRAAAHKEKIETARNMPQMVFHMDLASLPKLPMPHNRKPYGKCHEESNPV
jgi:hypothetical protein